MKINLSPVPCGVFALAYVLPSSLAAYIQHPLAPQQRFNGRHLQEFNTLCVPLESSPDPSTCPTDSVPFCWAARSPAYCADEASFDALIKARTEEITTNPTGVEAAGHWFQYLEDKAAGYLLSSNTGHSPPQIYCCVTDASDLGATCAASLSGPVVIKAVDGHSNVGVYAFSTGGVSAGSLSTEIITQQPMSLEDVVMGLQTMNPSKIIVEELIESAAGNLPIEYKFHMFNGVVGAIDVIMNRGSDCTCYAVIDIDCNRLDQQGCFETVEGSKVLDDSGCVAINSGLGMNRAGGVKNGLPICSNDLDLDPCAIQKMAEVATDISLQIGPYVRVDMFMDINDDPRLQEYSTNHMGGYRYCASTVDIFGCLNPCFLGELWDNNASPANKLYGGDPLAVPAYLSDWSTLTADEQCTRVTSTTPGLGFTSAITTCTAKPSDSPVSSPTVAPLAPLSVPGENVTMTPDMMFPSSFDGLTDPVLFFPQGGPIGPCFELNGGLADPPPLTTFTVADPGTITNADIGSGGGNPTFPNDNLIDVIGMALAALDDYDLSTVTQFVNEVTELSDFGASTDPLESAVLGGSYTPVPTTVLVPSDGSSITNVVCADPPLDGITSAPTVSPTSAPATSPTSAPTGSPVVGQTPAPTTSPTASPTVSPTMSPTSEPTGSPVVGQTPAPTSSPTTSPTLSPTAALVPLAMIGENVTAPPDSPPLIPLAFDNITEPVIFTPLNGPIGPCFGLNGASMNPDPSTTFTVVDSSTITNADIGTGGGSPTFPDSDLIDVIGMAMSALPDFGLEVVTQFVNEVTDGSDFGESTSALESSILNGQYPPYPSTVMVPPDGSDVTNVACADPPLFDTSASTSAPTLSPGATGSPTASPTDAPTMSPTQAIVQTNPPLTCTNFVRLDYEPSDIDTSDDLRRIFKNVGGVNVTIEATANKTNFPGTFGASRLNVYDTTGSPGQCDPDLENLVWSPANDQPTLPDFGNILVIQEDKGSCNHDTGPVYEEPNDDGGGGLITLTFSSPITLRGRIFVADQDENPMAAELYINDVSQGFVGGAGDSQVSVFLVPLGNPGGDIPNVNKMEFHLEGSGGIGPVDICV